MGIITDISNPKKTPDLFSERYEILENETLTNCFQTDTVVSGSLLLNNRFVNVTFFGLVFFGSKIEDCQFIGCKFVGCKFQFSTIRGTEFNSSSFEDCQWDSTNITESTLKHCCLDVKTAYYLDKGNNRLEQCFSESGFTAPKKIAA